MSEGEMALLALDELPDEVLLRVLAGAGSKAILRAAACCRRLRELAKVLQSYRCFSSAASTKSDLGDALAEACDRALQGMLGCVDFALVFVANHDKLRGALAGKVVEGLLPRLPPGTPVVGCATAGLMGVGPGGAFELDPASRGAARSGGVALLLGRMPGCRVRAFCNLPPPPPPTPPPPHQQQQQLPEAQGAAGGRRPAKRPTPGPGGGASGTSRRTDAAIAAVIEWLTAAGAGGQAGPSLAPSTATAAAEGGGGGGGSGGGPAAAASGAAGAAASPAAAPPPPSARALGLQSVWVLTGGSSAAFELLDGAGGLLQWLQADERARPVIAGGISSGRGDLFFHPGRRPPSPPPPAGSQPGTSAAAVAATGREEEGEGAAAPAAVAADTLEEAEGSGSGRRSRRSSRSGTAAAAAAAATAGGGGGGDVWDAAVKGVHYVGLAVMAEEPAVRTGGGGGGGGAAAAVAVDGASAASAPPPPCAAPATAAEASLPAVRACALAMRGCAGLPGQPVFERVDISREPLSRRRRRRRQQGAAGSEDDSDSFSDSEDEDEDEGELVTVSGGVSAGGGSLLQQLRALVLANHSVPQLAVWRAERGDASLNTGLDVQVFRSGKMVMGVVEPQLLALYGIVAFRTTDVAALDAITSGSGSGSVVCCQLADITPQGCRLHLQAELPVLRRVASPFPLLPGGRPDPRHWEGYAVVRRAALRAGGRAGPVAMAVFSCTGRGRAIFGEASAECEARIADEVLQRGVPFIGAYCNGELGPFVRHGYAGWFFNPLLCVQPPAAAAAAAAAGSAAAADDDAGGEGAPAAAAAAPTTTKGSAARGGGGGGRGGSSGGGSGGRGPEHTVVADGRILPLDRTHMQGFTSVYAALG